MSWEYHIGHLYKTMREVVIQELGQAGQAAINEAVAGFAQRYGDKAAQMIVAYQDTDFDRLPD